MRPNYITNDDLLRWDRAIDDNPLIPSQMAQNPIIREVCYAGQWLREKLLELQCPDILIGRILYTAGTMCFGRDPWEIHHNMLDEFIAGVLVFETDPELSLN